MNVSPTVHAQLDWQQEGSCEGYRKYPLGSAERGEYLVEAHRLEFNFNQQEGSYDQP